MTIRVCKEGRSRHLIYSYDEEDYALLAAMYMWCDDYLEKNGVNTRQKNVYPSDPFFVSGFDLWGEEKGIIKFYKAFEGVFKNAIIGLYVPRSEHERMI